MGGGHGSRTRSRRDRFMCTMSLNQFKTILYIQLFLGIPLILQPRMFDKRGVRLLPCKKQVLWAVGTLPQVNNIFADCTLSHPQILLLYGHKQTKSHRSNICHCLINEYCLGIIVDDLVRCLSLVSLSCLFGAFALPEHCKRKQKLWI